MTQIAERTDHEELSRAVFGTVAVLLTSLEDTAFSERSRRRAGQMLQLLNAGPDAATPLEERVTALEARLSDEMRVRRIVVEDPENTERSLILEPGRFAVEGTAAVGFGPAVELNADNEAVDVNVRRGGNSVAHLGWTDLAGPYAKVGIEEHGNPFAELTPTGVRHGDDEQ